MAAASSAALIAPGLPIASVPTGMPPGICMIDKSESLPSSACVFIGTPSTGSGVIAAAMPGRCAAPPAPAMITLKPVSFARMGELVEALGRAVGGDDARVVGRSPSASSVSAACFIVAQSDWLPMMIATGFAGISPPNIRRPAEGSAAL